MQDVLPETDFRLFAVSVRRQVSPTSANSLRE
jgi:hypothetical protein